MRLQEEPNVSYNFGQIDDIEKSLDELKQELSRTHNIENVKESPKLNTHWNKSYYPSEQIWVLVYDDRVEIVTRDEYDAKTINT